jgi:hypothetical protein
MQIPDIPAVRIQRLAPKFWQAGGCITMSVMISEVLFGYFSRSCLPAKMVPAGQAGIPLIGGIQRAELFKESREAGSKKRKSN